MASHQGPARQVPADGINIAAQIYGLPLELQVGGDCVLIVPVGQACSADAQRRQRRVGRPGRGRPARRRRAEVQVADLARHQGEEKKEGQSNNLL